MFKFRLTSILTLREYKADLCLEEVTTRKRELLHKEKEIKSFKQRISALEKEKRSSTNGSISIEHLRDIENYRKYLEDLLLGLIEERKICEVNLKEAKDKLRTALKEKKIIYKLKDKEYQKFLYNQNINEQKMLDEMAFSRLI